jgi:hypothetical protein
MPAMAAHVACVLTPAADGTLYSAWVPACCCSCSTQLRKLGRQQMPHWLLLQVKLVMTLTAGRR